MINVIIFTLKHRFISAPSSFLFYFQEIFMQSFEAIEPSAIEPTSKIFFRQI